MISFETSARFPVSAEKLFRAWLDSDQHTRMTGGDAKCSAEVGGFFSAWDGYITGKNLNIEASTRIEQEWRTSQWGDEDAPSHLVITFADHGSEGEVTLIHSNIPEGQPDYLEGWKDHYFTPMQAYFGSA